MSRAEVARRGTTNGNARGSARDRAARRAWLMTAYQADVPGLCRCFRCGVLLFNPDDYPGAEWIWTLVATVQAQIARPLTVDRIVPGCQGGTYRRSNIRPACAACNSSTGGRTRSKR